MQRILDSKKRDKDRLVKLMSFINSNHPKLFFKDDQPVLEMRFGMSQIARVIEVDTGLPHALVMMRLVTCSKPRSYLEVDAHGVRHRKTYVGIKWASDFSGGKTYVNARLFTENRSDILLDAIRDVMVTPNFRSTTCYYGRDPKRVKFRRKVHLSNKLHWFQEQISSPLVTPDVEKDDADVIVDAILDNLSGETVDERKWVTDATETVGVHVSDVTWSQTMTELCIPDALKKQLGVMHPDEAAELEDAHYEKNVDEWLTKEMTDAAGMYRSKKGSMTRYDIFKYFQDQRKTKDRPQVPTILVMYEGYTPKGVESEVMKRETVRNYKSPRWLERKSFSPEFASLWANSTPRHSIHTKTNRRRQRPNQGHAHPSSSSSSSKSHSAKNNNNNHLKDRKRNNEEPVYNGKEAKRRHPQA